MFSRGFGGFVNFTLVIGNLHPNVALYQTEPHLVMNFFAHQDGIRTRDFYVPNAESEKARLFRHEAPLIPN